MPAFVALALGIGGTLLALSTIVEPDAPFLLAAVLLGLALPAILLTHRDSGSAGVRALLRDCVRPPSVWWWLPLAAFALPLATWTTGAVVGGAVPLTPGLVALYLADLVSNAVLINIWEEMAWTGFFQRRAASRWGDLRGSLVTAVFFTGIHIPLAVDGVSDLTGLATNLVVLAGVAVSVRLLIARVDVWSGRSLLTVGLLHASFNASENLLKPDWFWVRVVVTMVLGVVVVSLPQRRRPST